MIKKLKMLPHIVLFVAVFSSCIGIAPPPPPVPPAPPARGNYRPLTMALLKEIEKQVRGREGKDISNIQFYLSQDVVLLKNERESSLEVITKAGENLGEVYKRNSSKFEKIVLPKELPGVFTGYPNEAAVPAGKNINTNRRILVISFEENSKSLLYFSQNSLKEYDYFYLQPVDYNSIIQFRDPQRDYETMLRINYGGKDYIAAMQGSEIPYLMIKFNEVDNRPERKEITVPGRKVKPKNG